MAEYLAPGVYVEEFESGVKAMDVFEPVQQALLVWQVVDKQLENQD